MVWYVLDLFICGVFICGYFKLRGWEWYSKQSETTSRCFERRRKSERHLCQTLQPWKMNKNWFWNCQLAEMQHPFHPSKIQYTSSHFIGKMVKIVAELPELCSYQRIHQWISLGKNNGLAIRHTVDVVELHPVLVPWPLLTAISILLPDFSRSWK